MPLHRRVNCSARSSSSSSSRTEASDVSKLSEKEWLCLMACQQSKREQ
jgi:hypothetical protein